MNYKKKDWLLKYTIKLSVIILPKIKILQFDIFLYFKKFFLYNLVY